MKRHVPRIAAAAAAAVLVLLIAVPLVFAGGPVFFNRYADLSKDYAALQSSSHKGLACSDCHGDDRGALVQELAEAGDFYAGLVPGRKAPIFVRFEKPSREKCLACHGEEWSMEASRTAKVPHPAHPRLASETRECVQCHKWTAHEEAYAEKHKEMPFSGVCVAYGCHVGTKQTEECASCHHSLAEGKEWKVQHATVVRTAGTNGCLESCHEIGQCRQCHTTGKQPENVSGPAVESGMQSIQTLHVKKDWLQRHGAEALKGKADCMKCHVSDGECRECHARRPASHGSRETWIGQHEKTAKSKDDPRCLGCHAKSQCEDCHKQFKEMR